MVLFLTLFSLTKRGSYAISPINLWQGYDGDGGEAWVWARGLPRLRCGLNGGDGDRCDEKKRFDINGQVTGFGHPDWARTHEAASGTCPVVSTLVEGGATCIGKIVVDELAYGTRVTLKRDGVVLDLVLPPTKVNNLIFRRTWIDSPGEMIMTNQTTGDKAVLYFQPCGWFGVGRYEVDGYIYNAAEEPKILITGKWNESLSCQPCDLEGEPIPGAELKEVWHVADVPKNDKFQLAILFFLFISTWQSYY
ncbi:uncharacterized protein LOC133789746 [Humulus lupulus]|uniref:uncharacterized protein LOC133789746 n=1 Tax=Humulus lupulus TaxID=3486 RepID=UPI002B404025|nr:uncharacterized protein LOC133789746 [Humulus lupulus]